MDNRKKRRRSGRLQFTQEPDEQVRVQPVSAERKLRKEEKREIKESAKTERLQHKAEKTEAKVEKYDKKRDKYHQKQPVRKKRVKERYFDEKSGKTKTRLHFEKEAVPIKEAKWNKPKKKSIPRKVVGAAATAGVNKLHSKVYEVEHENVGTQAGHQAELLGESGYRGGKKSVRSAYRFVRNTPYRREAKFEVKSIKARSKLKYHKALRDQPELRSNPMSRFWQKRSIKKQYADALKSAKKSGKPVEKAVRGVKSTGKAITKVVRKNPILLLKAGIFLLIIFMIISLFSMCAMLFSGGSGFIGAATYSAEDDDINRAELFYTELETDLLMEALNAEGTHSGYDEYRYVGHDPLELMAFLTAVYEDFVFSDIEGVLRDIFSEQYQLEFVPEIEIRTRIETHWDWYYDPYLDEDVWYSYEVEVEYEWHILNVILVSRPLSSVINPRMDDEQTEHFAVLMMSRGGRQIVGNPFDFDVLPYVTSYFGYRVHPITGAKDYHKGLDIALPEGTEIRAGLDGKVTTAAFDSGYGNYVVIESRLEDGTVIEAKYAHCQMLFVSVGQLVNEGDVIATVGNTGSSTGSHVHVEILKDSVYMNPIYYMVTQ